MNRECEDLPNCGIKRLEEGGRGVGERERERERGREREQEGERK